jgi:hypothetical protein
MSTDDVPAAAPDRAYTCAACGDTFDTGWSDAEAHAEARVLWGVDGNAPGMVVICDDCFRIVRARADQAEGS